MTSTEPTDIETGRWDLVAQTITTRASELRLLQVQLAKRARVSLAIVRELQLNTHERRRSVRTLEALSAALELHPQHLCAVARGEIPPPLRVDEAQEEREDTILTRLADLEQRLANISTMLTSAFADPRSTFVAEVHRHLSPDCECEGVLPALIVVRPQ
ncbi:XRE family transcriptional regulator [Actinokineospora auranticolor]|uniref:Uncharacterized protein n=1 Tax=Actinokineospora auranticolor TaxID=155976 RepID=A0A2S6GGZ3_9PSEU|nr:XRE family transcriptional regulator [Actinokineospora auranticolor]PPK64470.1 hypothetical protein CLV40_11934 [Actinokineospora auranticolor]